MEWGGRSLGSKPPTPEGEMLGSWKLSPTTKFLAVCKRATFLGSNVFFGKMVDTGFGESDRAREEGR